MKKYFFITLFTLTTMQVSAQTDTLAKLKKAIETRLADEDGEFAVAFRNLQTGHMLLINAKGNFHAASTMKTPVMIEVFKQANAGKFKLSDSVEVKNTFRSIVDGSSFSLDISDDSADELYKKIGKKMTIHDLSYQMITVSSNLATNILIDLVGASNANHTMRMLGANDIQVMRGVEDTKAFRLGMNNTVTAYDLMIIFEQLAQLQVVGKNESEEMIKILLAQKFRDKIPGKLPGNVKVAHKTGSITGVQHDSGIVYLPDGRKYVIVLLSKNLKDEKKGISALAEVSAMIYNHIMR